MPWARIPADKLIHLPLFGIDIIADDGDFVWMRGPSGRMRVNKLMPRIWFESVEDAMQAGAVGIRIHSEADRSELKELEERLAKEADASEESQSGER
ncbi:hypothetical protein [Novosphingobium sp.]|uniref:hypothetical protein n=1 Tax=Novosphingobium sp. TaxID=1874826 RepID=UPI003BA908BA